MELLGGTGLDPSKMLLLADLCYLYVAQVRWFFDFLFMCSMKFYPDGKKTEGMSSSER